LTAYSLALFLHRIISKNILKLFSHIKDGFQLAKKLTNLCIDDNYGLISLDTTSLFTNISLDLAIESIANRWQFFSDKCNVPRDDFIQTLLLVLNSTFLTLMTAPINRLSERPWALRYHPS